MENITSGYTISTEQYYVAKYTRSEMVTSSIMYEEQRDQINKWSPVVLCVKSREIKSI